LSNKKKKMKFYEDVHKYIDNEQEYTPVTYFLKTFEPWKDWDAIAEKKAKKLGISKEELLAQWNEKKTKAAEKGTAFHKKMEGEYLSAVDGITVCDTKCLVSYVDTVEGVKEDNSMKLEDNTVYSEKMIWSEKYGLCGTADLVEVVNGKINVKDYKTNAKLDWESWKHPILGSAKLRFPVNMLDDCNGNIYQLQVNTYMYMLLQKNRHLKMGEMEILHVIFNEDGSHEIKPYKVKNLQKEVKAMLETFKEKRSKK
jgi:dihydroxyacetone kinase